MIDDLPQLLKKAATGDTASIDKLLGYFQNQSLIPPEKEQITLFLKAQKNHEAIYLLGLLYKHGYGIKQDAAMAFLQMREAAAKGNAKAMYEVGHAFLIGEGVEKNYANALQWLNVAASSPHYNANAMFDLGKIYEEGLGVAPDSTQSAQWYQKAAEKGRQS